jgi:two-component system CheB/CheR fusion protein
MALGLPVVGLASSAGGISALRSSFKTIPNKAGLAFVVVQCLSPAHVSRLVWLLSDSTRRTVREATDGTLVECDHVYVIALAGC